VRIAGAGTVGWGFATTAWENGKFFRFSITDVTPITCDTES
jgi:hypothetical protein